MRMLVVAGVFAASSVSAYAECSPGRDDIVALESWEAVDLGDSVYSLRLELKNIGNRSIRMVEGGTYFYDPLDRSVGGWKLPPDLVLAPEETQAQEWPRIVSPGDGGRLAKLRPDEVSTKTCVTAIVYDDGTVEEFE